jgi:hypothetical protein
LKQGERKSAEHAVLQQLGARVAVHGFKPKPIGHSFYRDVPEGRWALHVSFIRHEADIDVTADVAVRIEAIEQVANQCETGLTDAEKRRSTTLGAELGTLVGRQPLRWTVTAVEDAAAVADQIVRAFEEIGLPYLSSHSDVVSAYRVLASTAAADRLHSPILGARCMRAIAAAYVLGRDSDLDQLIRRCEAQLTAEDDLYLPDFRALSENLSLRR